MVGTGEDEGDDCICHPLKKIKGSLELTRLSGSTKIFDNNLFFRFPSLIRW